MVGTRRNGRFMLAFRLLDLHDSCASFLHLQRAKLSILVRGWGKPMKAGWIVCALLLAAVVTDCVDQQALRQQQQEQERAQLFARSQAAVDDCKTRFPVEDRQNIVAKMQCMNDAIAIKLSTFGRDQDLLQAWLADRMVIAEQVHNGKMTMIEATAAVREKWTKAVSESLRRNALAQVAADQREAAAAQRAAADAAQQAAWNSILISGLVAATNRPAPAPATQNVRVQTTCMQNGNMTFCH
jgi:hypothetical protein